MRGGVGGGVFLAEFGSRVTVTVTVTKRSYEDWLVESEPEEVQYFLAWLEDLAFEGSLTHHGLII